MSMTWFSRSKSSADLGASERRAVSVSAGEGVSVDDACGCWLADGMGLVPAVGRVVDGATEGEADGPAATAGAVASGDRSAKPGDGLPPERMTMPPMATAVTTRAKSTIPVNGDPPRPRVRRAIWTAGRRP